MRIKQIFNNNVILSENEKGEEIILIGKGIAFGLAKGNRVSDEKIDKIFQLKDEVGQKFKSLIQEMPYIHILVSEEIINYIKSNSKKRINDSIYVALTDHISNLVERTRMGIVFDTTLLLNIKSLYKEEYKLGMEATVILRKRLKIDINDSEASFIALHIINAELDSNMEETYVITSTIDEILNIVREKFIIKQIDNYSYDRFITHCRFFVQRVVKQENIHGIKVNENSTSYEVLATSHPKQNQCIDEICKFIQMKYSYDVVDDEKLYIMLHLIKLTEG